MKSSALLVALLFAGRANADAPKPKIDVSGPATLVPGTSIGPFRLGMTRAEIEKLGVPTSTPASSIIVSGPYEIALDRNDHVVSISRRLATDSNGKEITGSVILDGKSIAPKTSFADLRKRVPGCKAPEALIGGTVARCANHTFVGAAGPVGVVVIGIDR